MGLEFEKIKKSTEEVTRGKAEATLKVSNKHNVLTLTEMAFR